MHDMWFEKMVDMNYISSASLTNGQKNNCGD